MSNYARCTVQGMVRFNFLENLFVVYNDGKRMVLKDEQTGTVAFDGTVWLFEQCLTKGYFNEA